MAGLATALLLLSSPAPSSTANPPTPPETDIGINDEPVRVARNAFRSPSMVGRDRVAIRMHPPEEICLVIESQRFVDTVSVIHEPGSVRNALEGAMFEIKRVIAGQDELLERVFIALLTSGHLLIEGVPGLAKTLTVKTLAEVLGGSFQRIQFTPDLVPSDLVGTRILRPDFGGFDVELGPVICNFLLADEINRAPAKVQSALLEVMQERQVTIGPRTHPVPRPFLVMATQNPIESEGTYPLPEAQVDRFLMKVIVEYPSFGDEMTVVHRALGAPPRVEQVLSLADVEACQRATAAIYVDREVAEYAVTLVQATRDLAGHGCRDQAPYVTFGASPRGSISLVHAARALALLRGRSYVLPQDIQDLARDVLRHRIILSYQALSEGVSADQIVEAVLAKVPAPRLDFNRSVSA